MEEFIQGATADVLIHQQPLVVLNAVAHKLSAVGVLQTCQALHHAQEIILVLHHGHVAVDLLHGQDLAVGELGPVDAP